jgi:hypothetical protein
MPHVDTPWIGLIALVAMFALPFVPSWLFEGPRTIKHRQRRHICADCGAPWEDDHVCGVHPPAAAKRLRAYLMRVEPTAAIEPPRASSPEIGNF